MSRPPTRAVSPQLCVVVPVFDEAENLAALCAEVSAALAAVPCAWRFLFVDDGSRDATPDVLRALRRADPRVEYLRLSRNFGLQAALAAGLEHARGDAVIVMDADLQDDAAVLPAFVRAWREGADVVYAIRASRAEGPIRRWLFRTFYRVAAALADVPLPRDAGSFALYDRRVVDQINSLPETNRYLPGLRAWVGFRQIGIPVPRRPRHAGRPKQSFWRLVRLAADGIFSFSKAPLRLATALGLAVTALSMAALLVVAYWRFVQRSFPAGIGLATIALALLFLGGVQLLVAGIVGEYVGRIYDEVKRRPHYVIMPTEEDEQVAGAPQAARPEAVPAEPPG